MRTIITNHNPLAAGFEPAKSGKTKKSSGPIWIAPQGHFEQPAVFAYRLKFSLADFTITRIHVNADERYELWLDGQRLGRGPERGTPAAWFYETYDLTLSTGNDVLVARVWQLGKLAPMAQESVAVGFLLVAEGPHASLLSTGQASWEVKQVDGYSFELPDLKVYMVVGPNQCTNGQKYPWGIETGSGEGWEPVSNRSEDAQSITGIVGSRQLQPATLPAQLSSIHHTGKVRFATAQVEWSNPHEVFVPGEANQVKIVNEWQHLVDGQQAVQVPAYTRQQIVIDLDQYYCAYPQLLTSGGKGSSITIGWAEALYLEAEARTKGQRDEVEGRYFIALMQDVFEPDGAPHRRFESLWWRAGRYIQVLVKTSDEALTIEKICLEDGQHPF
jgi:alpha-L-rhamnosidase